jgi:hypothetical protein
MPIRYIRRGTAASPGFSLQESPGRSPCSAIFFEGATLAMPVGLIFVVDVLLEVPYSTVLAAMISSRQTEKRALEDSMDIYQEVIGMILAFVAGGAAGYYWEMLKMKF